jgi:hypothetical protein
LEMGSPKLTAQIGLKLLSASQVVRIISVSHQGLLGRPLSLVTHWVPKAFCWHSFKRSFTQKILNGHMACVGQGSGSFHSRLILTNSR